MLAPAKARANFGLLPLPESVMSLALRQRRQREDASKCRMKLFTISSITLVLTIIPTIATTTTLPLFNTTHSARLQTYHTCLSTLLPLLPLLSPPPSHTLLVTLATPAFKPLLYNWLCFLRYKAKWGRFSSKSAAGGGGSRQATTGGGIYDHDTPKVLVVTSDHGLAKELSEYGVVVWYLRSVPWHDFMDDEDVPDGSDEDGETHLSKKDWLDEVVAHDLFLNLRLLDLLLPAPSTVDSMRWKNNSMTPASKEESSFWKKGKKGGREVEEEAGEGDLRSKIIEWGSFHYQSLMLERTLVMSVLTGALVESQKVSLEERLAAEKEEKERIMAHDWTGDIPFVRDEFVGVKGVLVVDNDAVWFVLALHSFFRYTELTCSWFHRLSSPCSFLTHPYRPSGTYPSIIYAPDMAPNAENAWSGYSMPCACFLYTRTSDHQSSLASGLDSDPSSPTHPDHYHPAQLAAYVWRQVALCHISMLMTSMTEAKTQLEMLLGDPLDEFNPSTSPSPVYGNLNFTRAKAPSFQATCLGPALFLAEMSIDILPKVEHANWLDAIGSGDVDDLFALLDEGELWDDVGEHGLHHQHHHRGGCLRLAKRNWKISRNPEMWSGDLGRWDESRPVRSGAGLRTEALPYEIFPPGNEFFSQDDDDEEDGEEHEAKRDGTRACVVHANYATGGEKEKLLRGRNLWALLGGEPTANGKGGWMCDAQVMRDA